MIDRIVFWGLCAVLVFLPLPIGSVEEWSVFVFEAATIGLFVLYIGGRLFVGRKPNRPAMDFEGESAGLAGRMPRFSKALIGIFLGLSVLQIVPLPASVVSVLSPRAYAIYAGLVRDAVIAPSSWLTLSLSPSATLAELILIVCYGLFGYLVLRTVRSRGRAEVLVVVILASALFQSFYGMAETFSGHEMILGRPKRYNLGSVTGTFVNRNHFAGFLEMAFPLSLGYLLVKARYFAMEKGLSLRRRILWFGQESLQWTLLLGLVPVFIGVGLIFSKSRSGIMVLAVTAVLAIVAAASWREFSDANGEGRGLADDSRRRSGRMVRLVLMVVLAAAVWIGVGPVIRRFSEVDISAENRRTFYANTIRMIGDFPWSGTGKGTYVNAYAMYEKVDDHLRLSFAHNDYLEFASENGIVGGGALILAGIGLVFWLASMWRRRRSSFAKGIGLGAILGVTALLLHGFTDFNLQITANAVYFTTLAMLGVAVLRKNGDTYLRTVSPDQARPGQRGPRRSGRGHRPGARHPSRQRQAQNGDMHRRYVSPVSSSLPGFWPSSSSSPPSAILSASGIWPPTRRPAPGPATSRAPSRPSKRAWRRPHPNPPGPFSRSSWPVSTWRWPASPTKPDATRTGTSSATAPSPATAGPSPRTPSTPPPITRWARPTSSTISPS